MKIKVCGMRDPINIRKVMNSQPDFMGFIFYEGSLRNARGLLDVDLVKEISANTDTVGVFVNESREKILEIHQAYGLSYVQLHGDESVEYCAKLKNAGIRIIKALQIGEEVNFSSVLPYIPHIDLFLFDTQGRQRGGTGKKFNWELLKDYKGNLPFLLSGGISIDDVDDIAELRHPQLRGVDINSQFEIAPGVKDAELVSNFVRNIRDAV